MSLTTTSRTAMYTPSDMIIAADTVQGPGQGNWTYDDYASIPDDGKRYQIVDGVLFMLPSPNRWHQETVGEIFADLRDHVKQSKLGKVYIAPLDVELHPKTVVQPDVLVILTAHLERISDSRVIGAPDLVVEVASPGTAMYDRREKLDAYIQAGVPEYWIVDAASRTLEVLIIEAGTYSSHGIFEGAMIISSKIIANFPVRVEQFFA
jgi:Uma2 family endonuclease